jgi:hypothetical protein
MKPNESKIAEFDVEKEFNNFFEGSYESEIPFSCIPDDPKEVEALIAYCKLLYKAGFNKAKELYEQQLAELKREYWETAFRKGMEAMDAIEASECVYVDILGMLKDYESKKGGQDD